MATFCRAIDDEKCHCPACTSRAKKYARVLLRVMSIRPTIINIIPKTIFHPRTNNSLIAVKYTGQSRQTTERANEPRNGDTVDLCKRIH